MASPLLVIAYAIAGTVDIDFEKEPIGKNQKGESVFLRDIWPTRAEIQKVEQQYVIPVMFEEVYSKIESGSENWQQLVAPSGKLYPWDTSSTYIKNPPFFEGMTKVLCQESVTKVLLMTYFLGVASEEANNGSKSSS